MRSLLVEFFRFGEEDTGMFRRGDRYLITAGNRRVREVAMPLSHEEFLRLMKALRYRKVDDPPEKALDTMRSTVSDLLQVQSIGDLEHGDFPFQIDLVLNAAELAALPFETAADATGQYLALRQDRAVVITRRVRNDSTSVTPQWPPKPRILFAWASPEGVDAVPWEAHENELAAALEPWAPRGMNAKSPKLADVLTVLPRASIKSISEACRKSVEDGNPFTHVHLLAHGYPVGEEETLHFGVALHQGKLSLREAVSPEAIAGALAQLRGHAVVVTLAVCDSANAANTIVLRRSIAHHLHVTGFPVVVASQLPLTVAGSSILIEVFYGGLLAGKDVREAINDARVALSQCTDKSGHDWASMVAYVRLPENYPDYLRTVRLQSVLSALKAIQSWSDELINSGDIAKEADYVIGLLRGRSAKLQEYLANEDKALKELAEENYGLLGSTEKRIAEICFETGRQPEMRDCLEQARHYYEKGFLRNPGSHWTLTQCLSLEAVLTGEISERDRWVTASYLAQTWADKGEFWPLGSIAELCLIAPCAGISQDLNRAVEALREMKRRLGDSDSFELQSTKRQFLRYTRWWTNANGFFPSRPDLAEQARVLVDALA